jgi:Ca2+/Na+ antiporter
MSQNYENLGIKIIRGKEESEDKINYESIDKKNKIHNYNFLKLNSDFLWKINNLNKNNKYNLGIIFVFSFFIFFRIQLSLNFLFSFIFALFVAYIILYKQLQEQHNTLEEENKKISSMNIFNFKYLFLDIEIINVYYILQPIKNYNLTQFNNSLKYMDKFLKDYFKVKKKLLNKEENLESLVVYQIITNCKMHIIDSMNALMSIIFNVPDDINIDRIPIKKIIELNTKKIFYLSNKKLMEIIELYNMRWIDIKNININQYYIEENSPQPNPLLSQGYMPNYNLY